MSSHLLIFLLAQLAAVTYVFARLIALIPQPYEYGPDDEDSDDDSDVEQAHEDSDDEAVTCGSMAEARAFVSAHRMVGEEVEIHEAGCGENDGYDCDCEPDSFTVAEKAEA